MKPLTTWEGVKKGDQFTVLEVNPGLMNMKVGDHVYVASINHTGFAMNKVGDNNQKGEFDGYIYYPHMVAPYITIKTNEDALSLLMEED